jgi:phosphoglycerol transferase
MQDYDPLRGYLHSHRLRWSYGAMRERPADWGRELIDQPLAVALPAIAAAGFDGLYIDRRGYSRSDRELEAALRARLRAAPLVSPDRQLSFFDLRAYRARLAAVPRLGPAGLAALRSLTLYPTHVTDGPGVSPVPEPNQSGETTWWATARHATLALVDPVREPRTVLFFVTLRTGRGRGAVTVRYPDGVVTVVRATTHGVPIEHTLTLHPGRNNLSLVTTAPRIHAPTDTRTLYVQILDPRFADGPLAPLEARCLAPTSQPRICRLRV